MTRFAPSPTGPMHLGHVASALLARRLGTRFLLRIEDIDAGRCRPEYARWIGEDLRWLGIAWDGEVRVQSEHLAEYRAVLGQLREAGLTYPCFCTRAEVAREVAAAGSASHGPDDAPLYPGTCRRLDPAVAEARLAAGRPHAWRLDMTEALRRTGPLSWREGSERVPARAGLWGDVVLGRKDAPASYHLCVTHDDAAQGVSMVTRGADLRAATGVHRVLQQLMRWPEPEYRHHPLLVGADGQRLAKRRGSLAVRDMRAAGMAPEDVIAQAALD